MEFIDTHVHLGDERFAADREEVLTRARLKGIVRVIEIADSPSEWPAAVALSRARPAQVRCSLGLHPYYAGDFSEDLLAALKIKCRLPEVAAVGEIGLDYVKSPASREVQLKVFERMLAAALEFNKPVVVHCRGAYQDLRAVLPRFFGGPPRQNRFWGVAHCFSGGAEDAAFLSGLGFALGADGPVTYPKNDSLREAFRRAGASSLVLETDSPYLPVQSSRGQRNEPGAILEIAAKMAEVLGLPLEEIARVTTENARALYRMA